MAPLIPAQQVADIANIAYFQPRRAVSHTVLQRLKEIVAEVKRRYSGDVVMADDLDIF